MINVNNKEKFFYFTNKFNDDIKNKFSKFKNLSIIFTLNNNEKIDLNEFNKIKNFCRKNNLKIYYPDNQNQAINLKANGLFLSSKNKKTLNPFKRAFKIIGSAHNQKDFFIKRRQGCELIFLSPLFKNYKYSNNKILGIIKFNLYKKYWNKPIAALGGVNNQNYRKVSMTKSCAVGFINWMRTIKKSPPTFFLK